MFALSEVPNPFEKWCARNIWKVDYMLYMEVGYLKDVL